MKKNKIVKELRKFGWDKKREGANHEVWGNGLGQVDYLPRHADVNEFTAKSILKKAKKFPGKGAK
ncbi:MAG: hypothetical protein K940chlam3_00423 [Chlamydiae bacterium]|nr:hypothetical protein [Chlamydiota bacterium]